MIRVIVNYDPRLTKGELQIIRLPNRLSTEGLRALMRERIAPLSDAMILRHWMSKGAAFGRRWAPWAPSTLAKRIRKGNAAQGLMRDSDHLFRALLARRDVDARLRLTQRGIRLQLNTSVPYAIYHQVGTRFMPERQVIPDPLPRAFLQDVRAAIRQYVVEL
jgi:hypothetical protein